MSHKAYKYRIYPTQDQINALNLTFGCARFVWNKHFAAFYSYASIGPNPVVTSKLFKDNPDYSWRNDVSAGVLRKKIGISPLMAASMKCQMSYTCV